MDARTGTPMASAISSRSRSRRSLRPIASAVMAPISAPSRAPRTPVLSRRTSRRVSVAFVALLQQLRLHPLTRGSSAESSVGDIAVWRGVRDVLGLGGGSGLGGDRDEVRGQARDLNTAAQCRQRTGGLSGAAPAPGPVRCRRSGLGFRWTYCRWRQHDNRRAGVHRRVEHGVRGAREEAQRGGDPDEDLAPPQDLQGPPQVQRLLCSSGLRLNPRYLPLPRRGTAPRIIRLARERKFCRRADFEEFQPRDEGLVGRGTSLAESVTAGTRRPRPLEYQPRIGSVSPGAGSTAGAAAVPAVRCRASDAAGQRRTAHAPSSSASTSGPRWKARRMSWRPPRISSTMSTVREARSSRTVRRCRAGGSKRQVAVVLCGPLGGVADVLDVDFPGVA